MYSFFPCGYEFSTFLCRHHLFLLPDRRKENSAYISRDLDIQNSSVFISLEISIVLTLQVYFCHQLQSMADLDDLSISKIHLLCSHGHFFLKKKSIIFHNLVILVFQNIICILSCKIYSRYITSCSTLSRSNYILCKDTSEL